MQALTSNSLVYFFQKILKLRCWGASRHFLPITWISLFPENNVVECNVSNVILKFKGKTNNVFTILTIQSVNGPCHYQLHFITLHQDVFQSSLAAISSEN
jgi:hypothetical protein